MTTSIFERASKKKLRFESPMGGNMNVEDLWDLPLGNRPTKKFTLDDVAKDLSRKIKENDEESFVVKRTSANTDQHLRMDIVKHIIEVRMEEAEKATQALKQKARDEKILEVLAKKENEDLDNMSKEELQAMLSSKQG